MSKIAGLNLPFWIDPEYPHIIRDQRADIAVVEGTGTTIHEDEETARLIVQAVNSFEAMREMLFRALVELSYVQSVENCESGLCASAEGKSIIEEGMKLLGVKDLSEDALVEGEHNAD